MCNSKQKLNNECEKSINVCNPSIALVSVIKTAKLINI